MPSQGAPVSIWVHTYLVGWIYLNLGPRFRWLWNFPSLSWTKSKPKGWHGFRIFKFTKNRPRNFFNPQILWATVTHKDGQNNSTMKQTKYLIGNLSHAIPVRTSLHNIQNIIRHGYLCWINNWSGFKDNHVKCLLGDDSCIFSKQIGLPILFCEPAPVPAIWRPSADVATSGWQETWSGGNPSAYIYIYMYMCVQICKWI